jgi:hypothetical protein
MNDPWAWGLAFLLGVPPGLVLGASTVGDRRIGSERPSWERFMALVLSRTTTLKRGV